MPYHNQNRPAHTFQFLQNYDYSLFQIIFLHSSPLHAMHLCYMALPDMLIYHPHTHELNIHQNSHDTVPLHEPWHLRLCCNCLYCGSHISWYLSRITVSFRYILLIYIHNLLLSAEIIYLF